jgi:hypothetical protein
LLVKGIFHGTCHLFANRTWSLQTTRLLTFNTLQLCARGAGQYPAGPFICPLKRHSSLLTQDQLIVDGLAPDNRHANFAQGVLVLDDTQLDYLLALLGSSRSSAEAALNATTKATAALSSSVSRASTSTSAHMDVASTSNANGGCDTDACYRLRNGYDD